MIQGGQGGSKKYLISGWVERVSLPEWGVRKLAAKIDSGARSSSIDVTQLRILPNKRIQFFVITHRSKTGKRRVRVETRIKGYRRVKSSPKTDEKRYFVETLLKIGPFRKRITVNLFNRHQMVYRMIVGRTSLPKALLVDTTRRFALSRRVKAKHRRK